MSIHVSTWAAAELRRRAETESRTIVAVIDRLLGRPVGVTRSVGSTPKADDVVTAAPSAAVPSVVIEQQPGRCPKCGCSESMHQAGGSKQRCERHPTCAWSR